MSNVVEIYTCYEGQDLKQGVLETSQEIGNRNDAEADARYRCSEDNAIQRIAYYTLTEEGDTKKLLVYENPNFSGVQSEASAAHRQMSARTNGNGKNAAPTAAARTAAKHARRPKATGSSTVCWTWSPRKCRVSAVPRRLRRRRPPTSRITGHAGGCFACGRCAIQAALYRA